MKKENKTLRTYLLFYGTQSLSALGSGMTGYALVLWLYLRSGSALQTALLSACSYAPYVVMSIFAGALSDHWNKKRTMLACDLLAAASTVAAFALLKADMLQAWHLYLLNALNGLMNTVQQPAGEVASTLLIPEKYWQKMSGLALFFAVIEYDPHTGSRNRAVFFRRNPACDGGGSIYFCRSVLYTASICADTGRSAKKAAGRKPAAFCKRGAGMAWPKSTDPVSDSFSCQCQSGGVGL